MQQTHNASPWYRQVWPWLVMIPPAVAVVGGFTTLYLAIRHPEHEVCRNLLPDGVANRKAAAFADRALVVGCDGMG